MAKEAGSTTPTVYKRFLNKQALLKALADASGAQMNEHLFASKSIEDIAGVTLLSSKSIRMNINCSCMPGATFSIRSYRVRVAPGYWHSSPIVLGESPSATRVSFTPCCSCRTDPAIAPSVFPARRTPRREVHRTFLELADRLIEHQSGPSRLIVLLNNFRHNSI